jgi:hypothetical protein
MLLVFKFSLIKRYRWIIALNVQSIFLLRLPQSSERVVAQAPTPSVTAAASNLLVLVSPSCYPSVRSSVSGSDYTWVTGPLAAICCSIAQLVESPQASLHASNSHKTAVSLPPCPFWHGGPRNQYSSFQTVNRKESICVDAVLSLMWAALADAATLTRQTWAFSRRGAHVLHDTWCGPCDKGVDSFLPSRSTTTMLVFVETNCPVHCVAFCLCSCCRPCVTFLSVCIAKWRDNLFLSRSSVERFSVALCLRSEAVTLLKIRTISSGTRSRTFAVHTSSTSQLGFVLQVAMQWLNDQTRLQAYYVRARI